MTMSRTTMSRTALSAMLRASALAAPVLFAIAPARATTWKLDPVKSTLGFSGTQTGAKFEGRFKSYQADISFDPKHPEASHIVVTVDLASAATGDPQRDAALPDKDWFDVAHFPQARFEAARIRKTAENSYEAEGTLTLRGISRPVVLPFTLDVNGTTAHAKGHVQLIRTDFGVGQGPWSSGQWVALEAGVDIDILAKRAD